MSAAPIDFYFDFVSPYGYFASRRIDALGESLGRRVRWRAILLGPILKETGAAPFTTGPSKARYGTHDWARIARADGAPYVFPDPFPYATLALTRCFYVLEDRDPALAHAFAKRAYEAVFTAGRPVTEPAEVVAIAAAAGADPTGLAEAMTSPAAKERLKAEIAAAAEAGVIGSPFFIVDGEPFWGSDRMDELRRWVETGGW